MPVVKGGVWTNIEDEILKASVSKYGLNQWARVSSLLARKTAKQCKARWTEWLDPSIKKIEWSREEDEKLLHLAKLMPTQWRTIAPIVGRTANQCLDRYQKLLDEAEAKESADLGLTGPDGAETRAPTGEDLRRLRPGEVDTNPESKPARPDTIDLDEDEKEMLSEARARLANTQGKKAKRKARERQQEESRRLANLQKRRELKTAGINVKVVTRKPGQMDYNADIPFEKKPAPGFHDTSEEQERNEFQRANFDPRKLQLASGKRKGEGEDADADHKRRKNNNSNDPDGAPSASIQAAIKAGQMQKMREAEQSSKRRALVLPAPQVNEAELDEIVKAGRVGEEASRMAREGGEADSTRGLVGSYAQLNTSTPIRTPMMAPHEDHIANELRNIRAQANNQSVLLGGENPNLYEGKGSTGFESAAPRKQVISTPNPLATPLRQGLGPGATPLRPGQTPMRTPRDQFALNTGDGAAAYGATPRDGRASQLAFRGGSLRQGLAALPKPKALELDLPELEERRYEAVADDQIEDAGERDRRLKREEEARLTAERKRQTQVIQRNLPRPVEINLESLYAMAGSAEAPEHGLITVEMARLMAHDALKFPSAGSRVVGGAPEALEKIDDDAIAAARRQLVIETTAALDVEHVAEVFGARNRNAILLGLTGYEDEDEDDEAQAAATTKKFSALRTRLLSAAEADVKRESKLDKHLRGYEMRHKSLLAKTTAAAEALAKAQRALAGFRALASSEQVAVQRRLDALRDEVMFVSRREREAQEAYRAAQEELAVVGGGVAVNGY